MIFGFCTFEIDSHFFGVHGVMLHCQKENSFLARQLPVGYTFLTSTVLSNNG